MKKTYEKPALVKTSQLTRVVANGSGSVGQPGGVGDSGGGGG